MPEKSFSGKEKNQRMGIPIRLQYTLIIVGILACVILALYLVNVTGLERYTISRKQSQIKEALQTIQTYVESDFSEEAVLDLDRMAKNSNIDVLVLSAQGILPQVIYASDMNSDRNANILLDYMWGQSPGAEEIYQQTDSYVIYRAYNNRLGNSQINCIGIMGDVGFLMSTPLQSIRESVELSSRFLLFLGVAAMVFGALLVYVVTSRLTRPIRELSHISEQMAQLHFDVRYTGRQKNEIGVLGESMNHMSDSLEQAIGELRSANVQLEKDLREKERIDEMRRLFLSNVSHELKTPIALIQGYSEGLRDGISDDPESMAFYCDVIIDEAQKMNHIVKRLLNLDEMESGQMEPVREIFNLIEVLRGVVQSTRMLAEESGCEVKLQTEDEILVYADEFMIEEVVQNYLTNAYHYVSRPGVVTISTIRQGGNVVVSVHNTGQAIPEEDLEHVWEKFYKVDKARTRSYGGSGIGLSIVKAIMNNHKGDCGVLNRDEGVDFWFRLDTIAKEETERLE